MKKTLKSVALVSTLCGGLLHASWEYRTPLSAQWRGYFHWQLASVEDAWWYDGMPAQKENTKWNFHTWGVGYTRTASQAFFDPCGNHNTRDTTSLSSLIFGKEKFRGEAAFTNGTFATASLKDQALLMNNNPFLGFAFISPRFDYNEQGAYMGIEFSRNFGSEGKWHAGGRVSIPYKVIEVEQEADYTLEETLSDVISTQIISLNETLGGNNNGEYAMRFDFLNVLNFNTVTTPANLTTVAPFVQYTTTGAPAGQIRVGGELITGATPNEAGIAAYVTESFDGDLPSVPFRRMDTEVSGVLGANGEGVDGATYFLQTSVPYASELKNDRDAQGRLFIVPRAESVPGSNVNTKSTDNALDIYDTLLPLLEVDLFNAEVASDFFLNNGIDLAGYSRNVGIGDLAAEAYVGYGDKQNWFFDGILGLSFPTGNRQKSSNDLYWKSTGNNGHVELKLGIDTGWMARPWFAFEFDLAYHHAFKRSEKRAAAFEGATVINLGPELEADVSWNYFVGRIDLNFFHPQNPDLGFTFGYELFAKGKDNVKFGCDATTATDLLGRPDQPLAPCLYEKRTNALSNKLRAQIFNRWNFFEVFAGGSQVVAGRDVMKETEGHIGFVAYF